MNQILIEEPLIHVGFMKTGSTWLQKYVFNETNGHAFCVPWENTRARAIEAFVLSEEKNISTNQARDIFTISAAESINHLMPVISEETLAGSPNHRRYNGISVAKRVKACFPKAKILITIREQKSAALSLYKEYLAQGGICTFYEFVGTGSEEIGLTSVLSESYLNYETLIHHYIDLYGKENVLVLPFELLGRDESMFVKRLQTFCEINPSTFDHVGPNNVGLPASIFEIRRLLNHFYHINPVNPKIKTPNRMFVELTSKLITRLVPDFLNSYFETKYKGKIEERFLETFREGNLIINKLMAGELIDYGYDL